MSAPGWHVARIALTVHVNPEEFATLVAAARRVGEPVADFVLRAALREAALPPLPDWELGVKAACLRAAPHELSVLGGDEP